MFESEANLIFHCLFRALDSQREIWPDVKSNQIKYFPKLVSSLTVEASGLFRHRILCACILLFFFGRMNASILDAETKS